ncbi:DmX-like protein 1 [Willisornis vidua]|uniref:DmX-like protein 1 n=1 Tax=Willisornis vidua TaxID=1566151 RepID=A0ABQ9DWK5_9PASS|nr:DmX-like protein 1 [Willisornis vidua]
MNLHQVLTGAVNPGDSCFSVGSLRDQPFTAYASGCDIVVLGTDFERLQIIPGAKHGNIQVGCVDCSMQQGKVLHYQWQKNAQITLEGIAHNLTWDPTGTRLLTGSNCLQLWSNITLENPSDNDSAERTDVGLGEWRCIWQCKPASQVCLMKFSPDGEFFATAGKDDCLVKVWYNTESWRSAITPPGASPENQAKEIDFSFVYLAHPRSVNGFSWRKTSKFMPRGAVCNVLLTCCKDNVCRLWAETLLPNDSLLYGGGYSNWSEAVNFTNNFKRNISSKEKVQSALELNLRHFRRGRRRSGAVVAHTGYAPHQQDPHEVHRSIPPHANALCHFHIAASINPATDIPLLPSITSLSLGENEEKSGPFVVHWLNNKELHFTLSMEVFLQQLKRSFEHHSPETIAEESNQMDGRSEEEADENGDEQKGNQEKKELSDEKATPNSSLVPLSSAIIDHEIEVLLSEWSKNADMLFSIHPMDGSLLVWHVDWLDEYQPGMFRQVQVSFVSRIPVAFPTGDANSLCRSIVMYACTKNVDLAIQQGKQKPSGLTRSSSMLISSGHSKSTNSLKLSIFTPNVMMISKHADGSLNQWLVSFAEESAFSTVLSISHKSRYCGHRFHLNDLACHSVLPLLLTTSHHNALISPDVENPVQSNDGLNSQESPVRLQSRGNANVTSQDPNAVYSELILWRVDPVGPLSFSGGVSELARINSLHVSAFSNVAWLPTLIPSYCLGAYCNSPSACFVASDGQHLRLYQAVIDAKKLLYELSNPEISHGRKTQLFHVFQEDFILNNQEKEMPAKKNNLSDSGNQQNGFSEKFYLIVVEYTENHSLLHMWHLHLKSIPVSIDEKIGSNLPDEATQTEELYSSPDPEKIQSPFTQKYRACRANLQSTSWLTLSSKMVYSQELNMPEGVEIISVKPSAGHLSSSSIYPVCRAPYLLATSCSDGKVRFWRCRVVTESSASSLPEYSTHGDVKYVWEEWPLLIEDGLPSSSAINVPGRPTEVSCAHTNRLAVAYKQVASKNGHLSQDVAMHVNIFECESTGGSSWILEQTLNLDEIGTMLDSGVSIDSNLVAYNQQDTSVSQGGSITPSTKHLVHLDWMSREDGSHILTVGIGSKLYMFGQLSGKRQEQNGNEMATISHSGSTKTTTFSGFVLLRCVDLVSSVEGSPPFPVSLSWVRDGILVVGMDCEMHVYSQWQSHAKQELVSTDSCSGSVPCITSLMKQSHSAASGLHPPKRTLTRSMTSLAQKLSGKRSACDLSVEMEDSGLFEAAHTLSPTLPQYHPYQLLELMDLGKVRRTKAILSHLVKCIAGEVVAVNESEPNHDKRLRSLTISASGSTARDPKTFSKTETTDYVEIDSVPPLPLYALLAADDDSSYSCSDKTNNQNSQNKKDMPNDNYENLFQNTVVSTDDLVAFDTDDDSLKPKVIDLSQYSPTYFGPEHAQVLSRHLLHSSLPGLSRMEQMSLMALADTIATTSTDIGESRDRSQGGETLDECGLKFLLAVRLHTFLTTALPPVHRAQLLHQGLSTSHFAWAFHSVAEEELLNMLPAVQKGDPTWSELRAMGVGWWVRNIHSLRKCIEKVAKAAFQRNNDPLDAAIFYLAMKKKTVIWGLYRLYESEFEVSSTYKSVLQKRVLGSVFTGKESSRNIHCDPFLRSMAYWILEDYGKALDTLIKHPVEDEGDEGDGSSSCSPAVFNFYNYLRTHPLLLRRHFGSSDTSSTHICLTVENGLADKINLGERRLFFTTAYAHLKAGCPMLALEVLSKMPKVVKRSKSFCKSPSLMDTSKDFSPSSPVREFETKDESSSVDWSQPVWNGLASSSDCSSEKHSSSTLSFDWSQPCVVFQDEPLQLQTDSDENDEDEDSSLVMKDVRPLKKTEKSYETSTSYTESFSVGDDKDILSPSEDIISAQLKFRACLKILTVELRTLSTGYEVDGGKLRYQLYQWLEREVVALQKTCDYNVEVEEIPSVIRVMPEETTLHENTEDLADQQRNMMRREHFQKRRQWLLKYQSLLRMFLSYCILHGSHGGGLASVRMELILLLQELQQEQSVQLPSSPPAEQGSVPLLFACTASAKTVVANPLLHLGNLTHDILHAIINLDSPPHPDTQNNKVYVMHTLAASLSACIYQCLCDGHSYSSFQANQFTGTVYQTVLLTQRHSLRTASSEETVTPSTSPAQWPDDEEKQQKHFRLSSKTSPKESSQLPALSSVDQESPSCRERFIPPELSIWDYFIAKPFLPSQSRVEYDSEESQTSDEDDEYVDGDVFASNSHNQEHSNSNSYSWSLMRLAMVQLVLHNLKIFYPLAGHDLSELPVSSPICHAVLKTLQRWEQVLLRRLELYGGPPQHYISVHASEDALAAGPALLRHKTLLEPTNTPFRSSSHVALSVKRLWQYLVKQEEVQETFIRNIFTKKRCLSEIETDLGYPGGKARIIHKESDIITAFAVNKANRNCIAIASSHDIQELDVSAILATQIYTWVDDDVEIENKGADDFLVIHARDDLVNVQGTTPYTHSNPGTPINMPWLGSTQTGRGASVEYSNKFNGIRKELARKEMLKKAINNVRRMASHPTLPYYLTGAQDGSVRMFEWGHAQQIACFRSGGNSRVTRMRFNYQGNKTWQCHSKTANDFVFISSSSLIATAGLSSDNRNICLWDTLVSPSNSLVHAFICHDSGATVLAYAPKHQLLISGGRKGFTCVIDLRQKQQQQLLQSHDSPVKAIAVDPTEEYFVTGSAEGNIKVWSLSTFNLLHTFINEHTRQSLFRNIGTGVMQIETGPANHIFSCGADGTVKMRILPDRFSPLKDVLKNDVKFMI